MTIYFLFAMCNDPMINFIPVSFVASSLPDQEKQAEVEASHVVQQIQQNLHLPGLCFQSTLF